MAELTFDWGDAAPVSVAFKSPAVANEFAAIDPALQQIAQNTPVPITITSGIRSPAQNTAVGGVPNSFHLTGQALDIRKSEATPQVMKHFSDNGYKVIDEGDHLHVEPIKGAKAPKVEQQPVTFDWGSVEDPPIQQQEPIQEQPSKELTPLQKSYLTARTMGSLVSRIGGSANPINFIKNALYGRSLVGRQVENAADYGVQKAIGLNPTYDQIKAQNEITTPTNVPVQIAASFGKDAVPTMVGRGIERGLTNLGSALPSTGIAGKIVRYAGPVVKGAATGTLTGAALPAISNIDEVVQGRDITPQMKAGAMWGGGIGAGLGAVQGGARLTSDVQSGLLRAGRANVKLDNIVKGFQNQLGKAAKPEYSDTEISDMWLKSMKQFDANSYQKFQDTTGKFLTKDPAKATQASKVIVDYLDDLGVIQKTESGNFVLNTDKVTGLKTPAQTGIGQRGIQIGKASPQEQKEMLDAFETLQAPSKQTIAGLQETKQGFQDKANYAIPGSDKTDKLLGAALKQDVLTAVEKVHGPEARQAVESAYALSAKNIRISNDLKKYFQTIDPNKPPEATQVYKRIFDAFKSKPNLVTKMESVAGKENYSKFVDAFQNHLIQRGTRASGDFAPNQFMIALKTYGYGTPNDALKRVLSPSDYQRIVRLANLSKESLRMGLGDVPSIGGLVREGGDPNVTTTFKKLVGGGSMGKLEVMANYLTEAFKKNRGAMRATKQFADSVDSALTGRLGAGGVLGNKP